jgi:hypothetical protein
MIEEIRGGGKEKFKNQNAKIKDVESAGGQAFQLIIGAEKSNRFLAMLGMTAGEHRMTNKEFRSKKENPEAGFGAKR